MWRDMVRISSSWEINIKYINIYIFLWGEGVYLKFRYNENVLSRFDEDFLKRFSRLRVLS